MAKEDLAKPMEQANVNRFGGVVCFKNPPCSLSLDPKTRSAAQRLMSGLKDDWMLRRTMTNLLFNPHNVQQSHWLTVL